MSQNTPFTTEVARKYQLYNGLFLGLPFEGVRDAGIMLPVFATYCKEKLAVGKKPSEIVATFIEERLPTLGKKERLDYLFRFMQLAERQIVMFDALEDAAFSRVHQLDGPGSIGGLYERVKTQGKLPELRALLKDYRVRVVLTAHPTQFYPDEVLGIITDLSDALERGDTNDVYELLMQMGQTRFRNTEKPTPIDEATSLLWYLQNVFYETIPTIQRELTDLAAEENSAHALAPVLELGFWPGGDRDGNPYVTADVTAHIGSLLRRSVLELYLADIRKLARRLTFPGVGELLQEIADRIQRTISPFVELPISVEQDHEFCVEPDERQYRSPEELAADLRRAHELLIEHNKGLYRERLESLMYKVAAFGFHFASLDLRQDSRIHAAVVGNILASLGKLAAGTSYAELSPSEKIETLYKAAEDLPAAEQIIGGISEQIDIDTIRSLQAATRIQERNGVRGMHRYIISNTQTEANVAEVWFLAACAGMPTDKLPIDIVPLFETIDDLHAATGVMERLYDDERYAEHLTSRRNKQTIMLGFSDGTKDGGYVTANWEIFKAKRRLTAQASRRGLSVTFFDGRGGPPARGGGNTHRFYRSFGKTVASREIQLTIQGQTVSSKYGTPDAARYNLEQLLTAGLDTNVLANEQHILTEEQNNLLDSLATRAYGVYQDLKEHPRFLSYLRDRTPLTFYGKTNIASRPTQRGGSDEISLSTLRAIPFVG
ncbi:MAG: phosphoenolpyruvate carboxylase, partial [Spirochaetota bacterium]